MKKFVYGSFVYNYDLLLQDRKTLSLTVHTDLSIVVKAPKEASDEKIEKFLKKKWFWLEKKLSFFKTHKRKIYKREYVSGEEFLYLGKQYRLLVKKAKKDSVKLTKNDIVIYSMPGASPDFLDAPFSSYLKEHKADLAG